MNIILINKKNTFRVFLLVFLFCFVFLGVKNTQAALGIDDNIKQVKYPNRSTIYYLNHKQKIKKAYINEEAYLSYGNKWSDVKVISPAYLDLWKEMKVVKTKNNPTIYSIEGGKKRAIKSAEEFLRLGYDWSQVMGISMFDLLQYASADDDFVIKNNNVALGEVKNVKNEAYVNTTAKVAGVKYEAKNESSNIVIEGIKPNVNTGVNTTSVDKDTSTSSVNINNNQIRLYWPVNGQVNFGFHDPRYPFNSVHQAIDIRASQGTSVRAAQSGTVITVVCGSLSAYGYMVIDHGGGFKTVYGHLSQMNAAVGQRVAASEVIGKSGGTPGTPGAGQNSNGPHLHFEVVKDGFYVDPEIYLR